MELLRGFEGTAARPHRLPRQRERSSRGNFPDGLSLPLGPCAGLGALSLDAQERLLIRGMISILGLTPHDVVWSERTRFGDCKIHFHPKLNHQLVADAKDISTVACHHSVIRQFISDYGCTDFSLTLQSLVCSLGKFLDKFRLQLVYLSEAADRLTLKLLEQQIAQPRVVLLALFELCEAMTKQHLDGAAILSHLHSFVRSSGNSVVREVYERCLRDAMQPYVRMLRQWLQGKNVIDPKSEFMVQPQAAFLLEVDSIASKYDVRKQNVPSFLHDIIEDIFTAGCHAEVVNTVELKFNEDIDTTESAVEKYLPVKPDGKADSSFSVDELRSGVQAVLAETSATLFRLMHKYGELEEHLVSFKEIYLFVRADMFRRFCNLSRDQLIVSNALCSPMVLNNFLADAVTGSAASLFTQQHMRLKFLEDTLTTRLIARSVKEGLLKQDEAAVLLRSPQNSLNGSGHTFECITTDLQGDWILQHLLTPDTREMYELIFGVRLQLFLGECFCVDVIPFCDQYAGALLRRMLVFSQSVSAYFSIFSVEQEWSRLQKRLSQVRTVDSLIRTHTNYVRRIYRRCLLDNLDATMRLLSIAYTVLQASVCINRLVSAEASSTGQKGAAAVKTPQISVTSTIPECSIDVERELGALELSAMPEGGINDAVEYFDRQFDTAVARWLDISEIRTHEQLLTLLAMNECYIVK